MAAITPIYKKFVGYPFNKAFFTRATGTETIVISDAKWIEVQEGHLLNGGQLLIAHSPITVTVPTTTGTAVTYASGGTDCRTAGDYYILAGTELMYVENDATPTSATGTLTVKRGVCGTTASTQSGVSGFILNSLATTGTGAGLGVITYTKLGSDSREISFV